MHHFSRHGAAWFTACQGQEFVGSATEGRNFGVDHPALWITRRRRSPRSVDHSAVLDHSAVWNSRRPELPGPGSLEGGSSRLGSQGSILWQPVTSLSAYPLTGLVFLPGRARLGFGTQPAQRLGFSRCGATHLLRPATSSSSASRTAPNTGAKPRSSGADSTPRAPAAARLRSDVRAR